MKCKNENAFNAGGTHLHKPRIPQTHPRDKSSLVSWPNSAAPVLGLELAGTAACAIGRQMQWEQRGPT